MNTPCVQPITFGPVSRGNPAMWTVTSIPGGVGLLDAGPSEVYTEDSNAAAHVLPAAELTGGSLSVTLALTGALAAAENATTDTAANIIAALPAPGVGTAYKLRIINESSGNFAWTIVGGTGVTVTGTATVAQNTWREFVVTVTAVGGTPTVTLQNVGSGTYS